MMSEALTGALTFPAASVQVPVADCPAPSVLRRMGAVQVTPSDRLSVPVKLTVTFVLFQPLAFGAGKTDTLATGGVLSILMPVCVSWTVLPARSVHVAVADWLAPAVVIVCDTDG